MVSNGFAIVLLIFLLFEFFFFICFFYGRPYIVFYFINSENGSINILYNRKFDINKDWLILFIESKIKFYDRKVLFYSTVKVGLIIAILKDRNGVNIEINIDFNIEHYKEESKSIEIILIAI